MGEGKHTEIDFEAVSSGVLASIRPVIEREVRGAADQLYGATMEAVQDYLSDNINFNIKSQLEAAERERFTQWGRAERLERSQTDLLEALKTVRDYVTDAIQNADDPIIHVGLSMRQMMTDDLARIDAAITRATAPMQEDR